MKDIFWATVMFWVLLVVFNQDDNFARYLGQFGAEVVEGFASGGVP